MSQRCPNPKCDTELIDPDTGYSKVTMVEVPGEYDGGLFLSHMTEACGYAWQRFEDADMRKKAQKYIDEWNERRGFTATL